MDLSEQSLLTFIDLVYGAVEQPAQWRRFYETLQPALGVASIHMLALDKRHGTVSYSDGANLPVAGELAYLQQYRFIDPRLPLVLAKPVLDWTHCHQELDEAFVGRNPFYQDFLLPHDRRYLSATKLVDDAQATVVFGALSRAADGPMAPAAAAFLDRLLPHAARACRIGLRDFVYSSQALVGHLLMDRLRQPVLLMTPDGEVLHTNRSVDDLLRSTPLVSVHDCRIALPQTQQEELLRGCAQLEGLLKGGGEAAADDAGRFRSLRIAGDGGHTLHAFYTVLAPQGTMGRFGLRPVVMLFFYHPESAPAIDAALLHAVFGLTPAESRVAALLAEGLPLKQIAEAQGTQHETVRKQLRAIYQKTSTHRQPDLVRLLLHLPHNAMQG
jgi:DNA-binding CsgD family transcriptional regulator